VPRRNEKVASGKRERRLWPQIIIHSRIEDAPHLIGASSMRDKLTHRFPDAARLATFWLPLRGIRSFQTAS